MELEIPNSLGTQMSKIEGMGIDAPMEVLEGGGKQSKSLYRFDLVDAPAMFNMARILATGAEKYGENNWRKLPIESQINHAIAHLYAWLAGDRQDNHLGNALCRVMFATGSDQLSKLEDR